MPVIIHDMPEAEYHARPELSSTGARLLLESPAKFDYRRGKEFHSAAFDLGSAVHAKVLGVGWGIEELDFPDWRTKAAQQARDAAREVGLIPMLTKELEGVHAMTEAVLANPTAKALLELPGSREASVFGDVDGVPTRCRFDALTDDTAQGRFGIDLKTSAKPVDPDTFTRSVIDYGYDTQQEFYKDTYRASEGGELNFVFIAVEKEAPYLTTVLQLDTIYQSMGKAKAQRAREVYAECMASGIWPGYPTDVQLVAPPVWAAMQHEEKYG